MISQSVSSVAQSCPTLLNHGPQHSRPPCPSPTPDFSQTHVHRVGDAIQPSHPPLSPYPPALNLSQNQGFFKWVSSSHQVAKVLEFQIQHQSFITNISFLARILEWIAMPSSRWSSWLRDWTHIFYVSCIGRQILHHYQWWRIDHFFQDDLVPCNFIPFVALCIHTTVKIWEILAQESHRLPSITAPSSHFP